MSLFASVRLYSKLIWRYPLAAKLPNLQGVGLLAFSLVALVFFDGFVERSWKSFSLLAFHMAHPWAKSLWEAKPLLEAYSSFGMNAALIALVATLAWRSRKDPAIFLLVNQGQKAWITAALALAMPVLAITPAIRWSFEKTVGLAATSRDSGRGLGSQFGRLLLGAIGVAAIVNCFLTLLAMLTAPLIVALLLLIPGAGAELTPSLDPGPFVVFAALQAIALFLGLHGRLSEIALGSRPGLKAEAALLASIIPRSPAKASVAVGGFAAKALRAAQASLLEEGERSGALAEHERSALHKLDLPAQPAAPAKRL